MSFAMAGSLLGPALGPTIGGLLSQYMGWRAIFWFLVIIAAVWLVQFFIFYPETARKVVGNGSIPPPTWNMSLASYLKARKTPKEDRIAAEQMLDRGSRKLSFPNPLPTLAIVFQKDTSLLLLSNAILFAGFYDVAIGIKSIYKKTYHLNDLKIGLCYLPYGFGSAFSSAVNGQFLDFNYRLIAKQMGVPPVRNRHTDLKDFPIEKARLQMAFPLVACAVCLVIAFGWCVHFETHLAAPAVITFFLGFCLTGAFNTVDTLLIDLYPTTAATATAANNITRCWLGAGATAIIEPMLSAMGRGWCYTFIALVMACTGPVMMVLVRYGPKWREERRVRQIESEQVGNEQAQ